MSDSKEFILFTWQGAPQRIKSIHGLLPEKLQFDGVRTLKVTSSERALYLERMQSVVPNELLTAKIDFLYSIYLQSELAKAKHLKSYRNIREQLVDMNLKSLESVNSFLISEETFIIQTVDHFYETIKGELDSISSLEKLRFFRKNVSRKYALGGLFNLMAGVLDDI